MGSDALRAILVLVLSFRLLGCQPEPQPQGEKLSDRLYAAGNLPRFDFVIPDDSMRSLEADPTTYVPASMRYEDLTIDNLGIRLKGRTSFQSLDGKPGFKIKFGAFDQQTLGDLKGITLNNSYRDPSHMAERLAYLVFRAAGLPSPRANNALVYVNGEYYGVYVNLESEDKTFLARWFQDNDGNLYEIDMGDISPGPVERFELETNERENDRTDLEELLGVLERTTPDTLLADLEPVLDTAQLLRYCAAEAVTMQPDGYCFLLWGDDLPSNYRIYHDPRSHRFVTLPWSMDLAMKQRQGPRVLYSYVMYLCSQNQECRSRYDEACAEMADVFESCSLLDEVQRIRDQIETWIDRRSRSEIDLPAFQAEVEALREVIRDQPQWLRSQLAEPWSSLLPGNVKW